jgi:hypothetical protein
MDDQPVAARLRALYDERHRLVRAGLCPRPGGAEPADATAIVALRSFDVAGLVRGATLFAAGLARAEADQWYRCWTRARFLFGNPRNLTGRMTPRLVTGDAALAWLGLFPAQHPPGPARLLKPVRGTLPRLPSEIDLPGRTGRPRVLRVACRGLTAASYLVHLHHTLAEAVLGGELHPDDPIRLVHTGDLELACLPAAAYVRVHHDLTAGSADSACGPTSLRAYTHLSGAEL